jgi:peptide methionine sulfoxide reductase msrA/msrB
VLPVLAGYYKDSPCRVEPDGGERCCGLAGMTIVRRPEGLDCDRAKNFPCRRGHWLRTRKPLRLLIRESHCSKGHLMKMSILGMTLLAIVAAMLHGCAGKDAAEQPAAEATGLAVATFAGGCFWCVEADFEKVPGVATATSGYTGGHARAPSYEEVSSGTTGHREAVEVRYDPKVISYEGLLEAYWRIVDPTDAGGQFADRGPEYTTAIWHHTDAQRVVAERSKAEIDNSGRYRKPVVTPILPAMRFYKAEDKHQDYYLRHPMSYRFYRHLSGRDRYLERTWRGDLEVDFEAYTGTDGPPRDGPPASAMSES